MDEETLFRFAEIEKILIAAFSVKEPQKKAFRARLNHMRRPGIGCVPGLPKAGYGKHIIYRLKHLQYLFLTMHLNRMGIDPRVAGKLYRAVNEKGVKKMQIEQWFERVTELEKIEKTIGFDPEHEEPFTCGTKRDDLFVVLQIFNFNALGGVWEPGLNVGAGYGKEALGALADLSFGIPVSLVLNITALNAQLTASIDWVLKNGDR